MENMANEFDDMDDALKVEVVAACLNQGATQTGSMLEFLAAKLGSTFPDCTTIKRSGWFLSSNRPVESMTFQLEELCFEISKTKTGSFNTRVSKVVRGVALNSKEISAEQWISLLAESLSKLAQKDAQARLSMQKFII